MFALVSAARGEFLVELARISMFLQWIGLTSAALLCYARPLFARTTVRGVAVAAFAALIANTLLISEIVYWIGRYWARQSLDATLFPSDHATFLVRNALIAFVVVAVVLRYLFVSHQWRLHVRAEARSRIDALQARIRPHFLFNSMNTIAALTRSDPARAEEAVEDLADLFRATLRDTDMLLRLEEELELTKIYQRIEGLRLGSRLVVDWNVGDLPKSTRIPGLTIQPLLENAIYHGIEPLDAGGRVRIEGRIDGDDVVISVTNPVAKEAVGQRRGHRIALANISERLALAYGPRGRLEIEALPQEYRVTIRFPHAQ